MSKVQVLTFIKQSVAAGKDYTEIAEALNQQGSVTPTNKIAWTQSSVSYFARHNGFRRKASRKHKATVLGAQPTTPAPASSETIHGLGLDDIMDAMTSNLAKETKRKILRVLLA